MRRSSSKIIEYLRDTFAPRYDVIDVDGVRVDFGDGWGLVRASNTEPAITTRFEARNARARDRDSRANARQQSTSSCNNMLT